MNLIDRLLRRPEVPSVPEGADTRPQRPSPADLPFDPERVDIFQALRALHGEQAPGEVSWGTNASWTNASYKEGLGDRPDQISVASFMERQHLGSVDFPTSFDRSGKLDGTFFSAIGENKGPASENAAANHFIGYIQDQAIEGHDKLAAKHELLQGMSEVDQPGQETSLDAPGALDVSIGRD